MRIRTTSLLAAAAATALATGSADAAPIDITSQITNPSFENGDGGPLNAVNPAGWNGGGPGFRPRASSGSLTPTDGSSQAFMNAANGIAGWQLTGETIVAGTTYTLTADVGNAPAFTDVESVVIRLYGSALGENVALNETALSVGAAGTWKLNQSVSFTATGAENGQTLGVYIGVTSGTQAEWDNIRLTKVPEPGSLALMGLGGLCVLRRRRQA